MTPALVLVSKNYTGIELNWTFNNSDMDNKYAVRVSYHKHVMSPDLHGIYELPPFIPQKTLVSTSDVSSFQ